RARADGVFARGWNVAVLDARGYGDSGGHHASFGGREVDDLRAWVDAVAARVGPGLRLAAWGRSMGAGVALRASADDPRIRALVPGAETDRLASALGGPVERVDVEGARHSKIVDVGGPDLIARVGEFLDRSV